MKLKLSGQFFIFSAAVLWSTSGLFIKVIDFHPVVIAGIRSFIAALFLFAARFLERRKIGGSVLHDFINSLHNKYVWAGGLSYAGMMILFITANKITAAANVILLQYSAPVWAALFSRILLKEKLKAGQWAALILSASGLVLFFRSAIQEGSLAGDAIAVLSGVLFGASSVFMRMIFGQPESPQAKGTPADSMTLAHIITFLFMIPFLFFAPLRFNAANIAALLFLGIVQLGLASLCFAKGIAGVKAVSAMLISSIEPILNPLWVLLATGEKPSAFALLGGALIICAVLISSLRFSRRPLGRRSLRHF